MENLGNSGTDGRRAEGLKSSCCRSVRMAIFLIVLVLSGCTTTATKLPAETSKRIPEQIEEGKISNLPLDALLHQGYSYLDSGDFSLASLHFSTALSRNPDSTTALLGLGKTLSRLGKYPEALQALNAIPAGATEHLIALLEKGRLLRWQRDIEGAREVIESVIDIEPKNLEALTELAIIYDWQGKEIEAENLFRDVASLSPGQAFAQGNLGFNLLLQQKYDLAIQSFSRALSLAPTDKKLHNNLALAYALSGQEQKALQHFITAVGEAEAFNNLGYAYMSQGHQDKAREAFNKALQLKPRFYTRAKTNLNQLQISAQ